MNGRARTVAFLLLLLTFSVGGFAGMALEEAMGIDWFEFLDRDDRRAEDRLLAGLDLTREQRTRAGEILEGQEERLERYWESRLPEIQGILSDGYAEIRAILDPGQRGEFDRRVRALGGRLPAEVRD